MSGGSWACGGDEGGGVCFGRTRFAVMSALWAMGLFCGVRVSLERFFSLGNIESESERDEPAGVSFGFRSVSRSGSNMLVNTEKGDTFSFKEIRGWLEEADFTDVQSLEAPFRQRFSATRLACIKSRIACVTSIGNKSEKAQQTFDESASAGSPYFLVSAAWTCGVHLNLLHPRPTKLFSH